MPKHVTANLHTGGIVKGPGRTRKTIARLLRQAANRVDPRRPVGINIEERYVVADQLHFDITAVMKDLKNHGVM
jgi:hypothetical protein